MSPDEIDAKIAEAARSFDAELHTKAYGKTHSDATQLARLLSFLSPAAGQVILDLGTGAGYVSMAVAGADPECRVIGVDVAARAIARDLEQARAQGLSNAEFQSYDGVVLPFADDYFDAAVCRYAWHHLPRPETTLEELGRTVRRGGKLVLADAIRDDVDEVDFINRFQELKRDGHVRMHRRADLIELVCSHGFDVIKDFESSISFDRGRDTEYDQVLAKTPEQVLRAYSVAIAERKVSLKFRILNAVFVNRRERDGPHRPSAPTRRE